jgi:hyperosmotically inducible periplasmic protein
MQTQIRKLVLASGIALALGAASIAVAGDATVSQDVTDARQETQIWTTYALSPYLRAHDIKVSVHSGKATLRGKVDDDVNKDLAKQIALGVSGVTEVDNQLVVQPDYIPARSATERTFGEVVDDATITSAVKSKLLWSKQTGGLAIDVDTKSQRVTLKGSADSAEAKDVAGRLARNTRGVISVNNQLVVEAAHAGAAEKAGGSMAAAEREVTDSWITAKVKSTLAYSSNVNGSDIAVKTSKGIVTLSGKVSSGAERALAIELAQNVRGVKSVDAGGLTD